MVTTTKKLITETWVTATWNEYLENIKHPNCEKAKGYYHNGKYRIEMTPVSNEHSQDHSIINHAIYLYATLKGIPLTGKDNWGERNLRWQNFIFALFK
ncbi:hypothetical protein [Pleurocapsa sp. PCC 7319]|uniref:hypothetical protein n=1 Tax=Pleurocapsa sp. PCC 7319 TaxID=118161 RepID=UPI000348987B|nr:hypothetical protein [Pleurocapsa sp. PCC 7319]